MTKRIPYYPYRVTLVARSSLWFYLRSLWCELLYGF